MDHLWKRLLVLTILILPGALSAALDEDTALARSQSVIGSRLGNHRLIDSDDQPVNLHDLIDRPSVISLIYTSCYHTCPTTTRHLLGASRNARDALGQDSFRVITIGFDALNDDSEAMADFATRQGADDEDWLFLSADVETIGALVEELGFSYEKAPHGFDHMTQATVVDSGGRVYRQVYGELFELPWLVEPLKELVFGRPSEGGHLLSGLIGQIRLFCTVYDPRSGRYRFDFSLFIQIAIGALIVFTAMTYLVREIRLARRSRHT